MITFTVQGSLPDLNSIIDAAKKHYGAYSTMKKRATQKVMVACSSLPKLRGKNFFDITYYCKDKRIDQDNISVAKKFLLDGLVDAKIIPNDGWKEIGGWNESFYVDKDNPRIEVVITQRK